MKKRKGASTILVLFMVIVLIMIGLFTIVSANINYKLSKKTDSWSTTYYELDKKGEKSLAYFDKILQDCESEAINKSLKTYLNDLIDSDLDKAYYYFNQEYKEIIKEKVLEISKENDEIQLVETEDGSLRYAMVVRSDTDENFIIDIEVEVKDLLYDMSIIDGNIVGEKNFNETRYDIKKWKQSQ